MDHLDRVKEEFTRQADTFAVHAIKADEKVESRFQGAIGDAGKGVLLDVACGPGVVTAALAQNAARITAFDATPAMLEKARARCEEAGLANVEFREGDAQAMPFDDATFDGIVTRLAIHHFAEPAKVMSEMYRVLKPGGLCGHRRCHRVRQCGRSCLAERDRNHSRSYAHPHAARS
ncbi:MAG: class I SAM-dependent methyltransferase [Pseudomonadota bacterium]|nr:class I SAM-dependent methyltransferase [Pseudomonadota bacterium]